MKNFCLTDPRYSKDTKLQSVRLDDKAILEHYINKI